MKNEQKAPISASPFFWVNVVLAALLASLVIVAPLIDPGEAQPAGWARLIAIFGRDGTLRQTGIAAAVGLLVTAWVFFRAPATAPMPAAKPSRLPPPPTNVVGA